MEIVHIAAELAPVAKVGGMGDVLHGLSRALLAKGHQVEVILPHYDCLDWEGVSEGRVDGIPVTLIEVEDFFKRGTIYGCEDDALRFTSFCLAALRYLKENGRHPNVIHLHDWHTAVAAPLLKERFAELHAQCVFTIHNLAYQGECDGAVLDSIGWKSGAIEEKGTYNLMKAGILYADQVTTVSPNYAKEILNSEMGGALQPTLKKYQNKFSGVLNGLDAHYWNPAHDPLMPTSFSIENKGGKKQVKRALRQRLGLEQKESPLVGAVTRLVPQKGPELIKAALLHTLELGGQVVLLGSAFDPMTQAEFKKLKEQLAESNQGHVELTYDEELSHLIYGGSDLLLVPSLFEPCGLTQLIAMRYGTIPLVRETGGLVNTVFEGINGFTFGPPNPEAICKTLERALPLWGTPTWQMLQENGMREDHSWNKPSENYLKIYSSCLSFS
ncbi:MAG: Glycogen synthase [Chlamydiales bacterium]|nr:Glycogen synthase [Chlamydiales bacterium]